MILPDDSAESDAGICRRILRCGRSLLSSYAPARPERVHCEECWQKAVFR